MKKIVVIGGIVIVVGLIIFFGLKKREPAVEVQTEKVLKDNITQTVTGTGKIYPVTEVKISANVAGKILGIYAEEGDSVKTGEVLVRLEQEQYRASLDKAKSVLVGAQAQVKVSETELNRSTELHKKNLVSSADLETAQAKYDQAMSQLQQAQASLNEAEDALSKTVIRSPLNGVVIRKNKEVGEIALGSQFQEDVILVVANLTSMESRVEVNENDIVNVAIGDTASVDIDAFPDSVFHAIVTEISNSAETTGQGTLEEVTNFEVKLLLQEKLPGFRPGMSATADIATQTEKNVLTIPIQSLTARERKTLQTKKTMETTPAQREAEQASENARERRKKENELVEVVFVVEDGVAKMRPVTVGISDENYYQVIEGVREGEEVITGPFRILSRTLKDGEAVKVNNKISSRGSLTEGQ